ncbi:secretin N-terminal domain-containing protein [Bowmanella denitrificans]
MKNKAVFLLLAPLLTAVLTGCATSQQTGTPSDDKGDSKYRVNNIGDSFLKGGQLPAELSDEAGGDGQQQPQGGFSTLESMQKQEVVFSDRNLADAFADKAKYQVSANQMEVRDFLHYSFGQLLGVNYLLGPDLPGGSPVTLNISERISARRLFSLVEEVLNKRNMAIQYDGSVYLIVAKDPKSKVATKVGVGRELADIPKSSGKVVQVVPLLYGIKTTIKHTIEQLTDASVTIDAIQSALFVNGDVESVRRALELVQLLDSPATRGKFIGMVELAYIDPALYLEQMSTLLENEGIPNSINAPQSNNLVFVPLYQIGAVAIFSATQDLLNRVKFWTQTLDQPPKGDVKQYFVFNPRYARAKDIGESLRPLLDASYQQAARDKPTAAANAADAKGQSTGQLKTASRNLGVSNDRMTFVVDERSNALIFYSTGTEYKNVVPLVRKLDVLPKQVLMEVVIAEVNLSDSFKFGVEWALTQGDVKLSTDGAFEASGIGGLGLFAGDLTKDFARANLFASNSNINVLSRPSILVRDGVTANINIGEEVSIKGSTTNLDGGGAVESSEFRSTGITLNITPTVNAQGVVIMALNQSFSNQVPDSSGAGGNPNFFERSISTEVVAESGQTIMLAGLIDHRYNDSTSKVPGFGDLPLLGKLFKTEGDTGEKKELVLMITPKVITNMDQWSDIIARFREQLSGIQLPE